MKNLKSVVSVVGLLMVTIFFNQECQSQTAAPAAQPAPAAAAPTAAPAAAASGISGIRGKAVFAGTPPPMPKLKREADPFCGKTPMNDQEVLIGAGGSLKNVVIRVVSSGSPAVPPPAEPVQITQENCMYNPRVVTGIVGQKLLIKNMDPTLHNVHTYVGAATAFNQAQMKGSKDIEKAVQAGVMKFKCDVHPWMTGYVIGNDNPNICVTGGNGECALPNLAPGTYTVEAWHEKYGTKTATVTVAAGQTAAADFSFSATP